ncbi:MAG: hypothetical protein K0S39_2435, partial [Paenibacillus sp.]|nr:hypothetical protein [Paenibacillus sp.]
SSRVYRPGLHVDPSYDTSAFGAIYNLFFESILLVLLAKLHCKYQWLKYLLLAAIFFTANIVLKKVGILYSQVWWDPWLYVLHPLLLLMIAEAFSKRLSIGAFKGKQDDNFERGPLRSPNE